MSTLQGIFNTSVQAMLAQSQMMNNISTNIANVTTTGYKAQDTHFEDLINEVAPPDSSTFMTVNTFDSRNVDKQGTITTTQRTFDLALNGKGFFVTNTTNDATGTWQYTRDGSFYGKAIDLGTDTDGNGVDDMGTQLTTSNGNFVYGWAADASGNFDEQNDLTKLTPILFNNNSILPSKETANVGLQANLSAATSGRQSVGLPFIDASGNTRTLTVGFNAQVGGQTWTLDMSALDANNQPVPVSFDQPTITFGTDGKLDPSSPSTVNVTVDDASGPQTFALDLSKMTQYGGGSVVTVQNITNDGYIQGSLNNTYFNSSGVLVGSYSNGQVQNLYKLPVATFQADDNLTVDSGNMFEQSQGSGNLTLQGLTSSANSTQIVTGALETSTVDLADQFSKMIITQRAYSSASEVIRTADEMTQAARDLVQ